jgi:hypothetical protein
MSRDSSHGPALRHVACALAATLALLAGGLLAAAAPARANPSLQSIMMDDDLLIYNTEAVRDFSLDLMKRLGVNGLRVTVSWRFLADDLARRPARLRGARAADPRGYRNQLWVRFDNLLRAAAARGMFVLLNPTGPGPGWAHPRAPFSRRFDQPAWKPDVAAFAAFVKALGTRYSGSYRDAGGRLVPRVTLWSIWNEPTQPASLAPQTDFSPLVGHDVPVAPTLYRELYYAATGALQSTGHANDTILMGETSPLGAVRDTPRVHLWPKLFIREMLCVAPNGRRYTGREARARRCDELRRGGPFLVSGFAHHPYTQRNPPTQRDRFRDSVNYANIGELPALLDRLAATTGLLPRGLPIWLTEAGWETLPPDPTRGVSLALQATYMNQAERMAYDQPRVVSDTQFIFRDVLPVARFRGHPRQIAQYWATWQSGLLFANGTPKPSLTAYALPLDVQLAGPLAPDGGRDVRLWGQVRFLPPGETGYVQLQFRYAGSTAWYDVGDPVDVTDRMGFFDLRRHAPAPGVWRAVSDLGGSQVVSREVSAAF